MTDSNVTGSILETYGASHSKHWISEANPIESPAC